VTSHGGKVKSAFSFLDKVFHLAAATVKLNNLIWLHVHWRSKKIVHEKNFPKDLENAYRIGEHFLDERLADLD
jgi:hypothetical protein